MKKIIWIIVIIVLVGLGVWFSQENTKESQQQTENRQIKIGAILPLSGVTAVWGEDAQRGMELAQEDLGDIFDIYIEDSQGIPAQGLSAYNKLLQVNGVDVVISMFSRISVPLSARAQEDQTPLFMTLVSAEDVPRDNDYAFRVFHKASQLGQLHFPLYKEAGYKKLALLHLNDEFGISVADSVRAEAAKEGIELIEASYLPQDTDYRTQLTKIKAENPEALLFVGIPPIALTTVLQQSNELGFDVPVFELSGILENPATRRSIGDAGDGAFTVATSFDLLETGQDFYATYADRYGVEPSFAAAYAYDMLHIIAQGIEDGWKDGTTFINEIHSIKEFEGLHGEYAVDREGEFNPELRPAQFKDGKFEAVVLES